MIKKTYLLSLLFIISSYAEKHIFFEIDNILFFVNELEVVKNIPLLASLGEKIAHGYTSQFLKILANNTRYDSFKNAPVLFRNEPVPPLMCAYFLDKVSSEEAISKAKKIISEEISWFSPHRMPLNMAAESVFNPEMSASYLKPTKDIVKLLKTLSKDSKNHLYIFSNKNSKTLNCLKNNYPEIFEYFKDNIITSGSIHKLKPHYETYEYIFKKYNIKPKDAYFIENQPAYIKPPKKLGANWILWQEDQSINKILDQLS